MSFPKDIVLSDMKSPMQKYIPPTLMQWVIGRSYCECHYNVGKYIHFHFGNELLCFSCWDLGFPRWQEVKNVLAMTETRQTLAVSMGLEDALEEEITVHSSILAWGTPWQRSLALQSSELWRLRQDWVHMYHVETLVLL